MVLGPLSFGQFFFFSILVPGPNWPGGVGGSEPLGSHVGVGEFTTHFGLPILVVGLGDVKTGGTIWLLTHGHVRRHGHPKSWNHLEVACGSHPR